MWRTEGQAGEGGVSGGARSPLRLDVRRNDPEGMRLARLVAADCGIPVEQLFAPVRCRADVAQARQLGMYLMHVALQRLYADVGLFFGRDRTTVSHACGVIEEKREAPEFDERVGRLEQALAEPALEVRHAAA